MLFDITYKEPVGTWVVEPLSEPKWGWDNTGSAVLLTTKKVFKHKKFVDKTETLPFESLKDASEYAKKYSKLVSVKENNTNSLGNMFPELLKLKKTF